MMWHWPNKRLMRCLLTNFKVDINICVMLMVKKFLWNYIVEFIGQSNLDLIDADDIGNHLDDFFFNYIS